MRDQNPWRDSSGNCFWKLFLEIVSGNEITKDQLRTGNDAAIKYIGKSTPHQIKQGDSFVDQNLIKNKKYCEYGDILFAKFNRIQKIAGKSCVYLGDKKCLIGAGVIVLKHEQNPKYLGFVLSTNFVRNQMDHLLQESIVFQLYPKNLKQIKIPIPPIEVQNEIADFLDKFKKLENELERELERELENRKIQYEHYKNLIFNRGIEERNWELKTLEEIALDIISGNEVTKAQLGTGDYPSVKCGDINSQLPQQFKECISFVDLGIIKKPKYFEHGDILISNMSNKLSTIGKVVCYSGQEKCLAGDHVVILKTNQNNKFLTYSLSTESSRLQIKELSQKGIVHELHRSKLKQIKIPLPSLEEQSKVVEVLDKLYAISNDIKTGIPLLIKKNREQYNYYKEILLER